MKLQGDTVHQKDHHPPRFRWIGCHCVPSLAGSVNSTAWLLCLCTESSTLIEAHAVSSVTDWEAEAAGGPSEWVVIWGRGAWLLAQGLPWETLAALPVDMDVAGRDPVRGQERGQERGGCCVSAPEVWGLESPPGRRTDFLLCRSGHWVDREAGALSTCPSQSKRVWRGGSHQEVTVMT